VVSTCREGHVLVNTIIRAELETLARCLQTSNQAREDVQGFVDTHAAAMYANVWYMGYLAHEIQHPPIGTP